MTNFIMCYSISKITRYVLLFLLTLFLFGCNGPEKIDFLYSSFSGNGKLFSYSRIKNGIASIYITDSNGTIVKMVSDGINSSYQGAFLDGAFYYVEYSDDTKDSKILKCDVDASNCRKIYYSSGSVKCLFSYRNRLHFYQSPYVAANHADSGYANYEIKSVAFDGQNEMTHFGREFAYLTCPVKMNHNLYVSMIFPFEQNFEIKGKDVISRDDYTLIANDNNYEIRREKLEINRSIFLLQYVNTEISYVAINYDGKYRYGLCDNINTCEVAYPMTNPVYINNDFFYAVWDKEREIIQIHKW